MTDPVALPVTSVMVGVLLILLVVLSSMVTARRAVLGGIQFGDNENDVLRRRIRAHGNFVEIAPMVILAVGLMEFAGASTVLLLSLSATFVFGRILHGLRMYIGNPWIGLFSIISQHIICLIAAIWLLNHFIFQFKIIPGVLL